MSGYGGWYTIIGMTHLDICRSCIQQIGGSRFRNLFIPSVAKPADAKVRCSLSQPWARLAWVQTMILRLNHLDLLYLVTRPQPGQKPCSGRVPSVQSWHRVSEPDTGRTLPDFNACSSCFRNLQILMPKLRDEFRSGPLVHERVCDLRADSPRFIRYLDLLDTAVTRSLRHPRGHVDLRDFIRYAKRKSTIYDCARDHLAMGPWHYMPELPEFTICEDCYDDVVWPVGHYAVANRVSSTVQLVPGTDPARGGRQATCQLYSPRMRARFQEAVERGDITYLKAAVLRRYQAETRFRERKMYLLEDVARGYDCDAELRRNADEWKQNE